MSGLALQAHLFDDYPVRVVPIEDRPWFIARDLAEPLGVLPSAIRKQVMDLDPQDKGVTQSNTLGGAQELTIVSESGAIQLICQSRKPAARRLRKFVADLAVAWNRGEVVLRQDCVISNDAIAALPARVDQLAAENQTLAARVAKLEKRKKLPREMKLLSSPPQHEVDALLRAWHEQHGTEWVKLATILPLMEKVPTLLRAGRTEAARVLRFGHLLTGLDRVERHRKSDSRWVRLVAA